MAFWFLPAISALASYAMTGDIKKGILGGVLGMIPGGLGALGGGGAAAGAAAGKAASSGIGALLGKGAASAGAKSILGALPQAALTGGADTASKLAALSQAATAAPKAAGGLNGIMRIADWAKAHPLKTAAIIGSGVGMLPGETPRGVGTPAEDDGGYEGPYKATPRTQRPFPQRDGAASSYGNPEEPTIEDLYRYAQWGGEHNWFDGEGFFDGGMIRGPGTSRSDSIPIRASDGEFIFPTDVVAAIGDGSVESGGEKLQNLIDTVRRQTYGQ